MSGGHNEFETTRAVNAVSRGDPVLFRASNAAGEKVLYGAACLWSYSYGDQVDARSAAEAMILYIHHIWLLLY